MRKLPNKRKEILTMTSWYVELSLLSYDITLENELHPDPYSDIIYDKQCNHVKSYKNWTQTPDTLCQLYDHMTYLSMARNSALLVLSDKQKGLTFIASSKKRSHSMFIECHINIVVTEKLRVNILWRWLKNLFTQKGRQNILTLLFKSLLFFEHPLLFGFWGFEQYLNSLQITKILTKHTKSRGSLNNRISSGPELRRIPKYKFKWHMTGSQYKGKYLSGAS